MFGLSFGELVVVVIAAILLIGPKDMPKVLRRLGELAGRLRRMVSDVRTQSGLDDVLRHEGITKDIHEIRKLARGEFGDLQHAIRADAPTRPAAETSTQDVEREYPSEGVDAYGALPEASGVYEDAHEVGGDQVDRGLEGQ